MGESVKIEVELEDNVSKPAKKASKGLTSVEKSARKLGKSAKKSTSFIGDLRSSLIGSVTVANLASSAITAVGGAIKDAGTFLIRGVADAAAFNENLKFSLTKFLGDAGKADDAISDIAKVSDRLGISFQKSGSNFKAFISAGFNELESINLIRFKADILAVGDGTQETSQRVESAFSQIEKAMATGRIEADGFNSILANLPVTKMDVLGKLAEKTGVAVEKLAKTDVTKLPVKELIESFQEASLAATGAAKLGELAFEKQASSVSGATTAIKNRLTNLFDTIARKLGPAIEKTVLPALQKFISFLDSPKFANFIDVVVEGMAAGLKDLVSIAEDTGPKLLEMVEGFLEGMKASSEALAPFADALQGASADADGGANSFRALGEALGAVVGATRFLIALGRASAELTGLTNVIDFLKDAVKLFTTGTKSDLQGAVASFNEFVVGITAAVNPLGLLLTDTGRAMIDGLVAGIKSGASAVVGAITSTVKGAISAAEDLLDIGSPSRLFEEIGMNTAMGFERGLTGQQPRVDAATAGIVDPSALAALGPGGGINNLSANSSATINVQGAKDPAEVAIQVRDVLLDELLGTFEQLNIEVGG